MPELNSNQLWDRFKKFYFEFPTINLGLDISRMKFRDEFIEDFRPRLEKAFKAMDELEAGGIANPDENRMVGHYWLRNSQLAPTTEIRDSINKAITNIETFSSEVHKGIITGERGRFEHLLVVGIGGSALGPQFVSKALSQPREGTLQAWFIDNTDPDGIDHIKCKLSLIHI